MTSTSLDLCGKIDPLIVSALNQIQNITLKERILFFVVGATARDLLLEAAHGFISRRATADIDIAVILENWTQFDHIKKALLKSSDFEPGQKKHRLIFKDRLPVDIVPFGGVTEDDDHISWPPDGSFKMSVAGFEECYRESISVKLAEHPDVVVPVVSLAGLAILKLIAWDDNPERRRKDAPDLFFITQNYLDAGNVDRLFNEAMDIVEAENYDYDLGSAQFLGRDMSKISSTSTKAILIEILKRESQRAQGHRIAVDVLNSDRFGRLDYDRLVIYFDYLLKGLTEGNGR